MLYSGIEMTPKIGAYMRSRNGFTLIELLVVISIITILASLSIVGIVSALSTSNEKLTSMMIQDVVTALEQYQQSNGGLYPDIYTENIGPDIDPDNGTNTGIETCLLILRAKAGFPIESYQDRLGNTDADQNQSIYEFFNMGELKVDMFELIDPWGNPIVYIPEGHYDETFDYMDVNGDIIQVQAQPLALTGTYPRGYMIWSFGPDGVNQNGKGDDITSWKKSDEDKIDPNDLGAGLDDDDDGTGDTGDGGIIDD